MKILIVGPAWVGDMVIAQVLFKALKKKYPDAFIDVIAPDWSFPILERMPEVNAAIALPVSHGEFGLLKRYQLGKNLRNKKYAQAYVLPNSWKSALIPFFANIPVRTGWQGEMRIGLLNNIYKNKKKHYALMAERFLALAGDSALTLTSDLFPALKSASKNRFDLSGRKNKIIALCPGAEFGASKRWPEKYYAQIANYFIQKNYAVWLMGSQKDQKITEKINALTQSQCEDFAGKISLGEAVDLLDCAQLVITNDSGLMHIASALGKNMIALYGSTDPNFTPPLSVKNHAKILCVSPQALTCRPCFKRECPLKHHQCMNDLLPERVIAEAEKFD